MPGNITLEYSALAHSARKLGLTLFSAVSASTAEASLKINRAPLERWQSEGFAGEMVYMQREPELFTSLKNFLPEVRSVVVFGIPYSAKSPQHLPRGYGRVARYAYGKDYHQVIKEKLRAFVAQVEQGASQGTLKYRIFTDAVPLLERAIGQSANLGFIGKNSLLIREKLGSYFFIAEILWNAEVREISPSLGKIYSSGSAVPGERCGSCERCVVQCPTGAIVADGMIDAKQCISYLTIEKRSAFTEQEMEMVGEWVFGCDICQEVCPFNRLRELGIGAEEVLSELKESEPLILPLRGLLELDDVGFRSRFSDSAINRAGRAGLLRNALCVALNTRFFEVLPKIVDLSRTDPSEMVRAQAQQILKSFLLVSDGLDKRRILRALSGIV